MPHMNVGGRVCLYGNLSSYDNPRIQPMTPALDTAIAVKGLTITGFNVNSFDDKKKKEALDQIAEWCANGILEPKEVPIDGFESVPSTLANMMEGAYSGKVIVRA